ncbi:NAD-glutamate dehydrogenase domain-containing protein, partial [Nocardia sp. NPDC004722]
MVATTPQTMSWKRLHEDPADLEPSYFRWIRPGAATSTVSDTAARILRNHLELATSRRPGTAVIRVYRPAADGGLGPAIQIVNDDMPLLVDSVSSMLRRLGVVVTELVHPIFNVLRDNRGQLRAVSPVGNARIEAGDHTVTESWIHIQLAADTDVDRLDRAERALSALLRSIRQIAADTRTMVATARAVADDLEPAAPRDGDHAESARLLRWLTDERFTFLGYGYRPADPAQPVSTAVDSRPCPQMTDGLGVLHHRLAADIDLTLPALTAEAPALCLINGSLDTVLPGATDTCTLVVSDYDPDGGTDGEPVRVRGRHVFLGSFTVAGHHENILDIPVIAQRARQIIEWAGFGPNTFSGQAMLETMQTIPRAELFSADTRRLFETVAAVTNLGLRRQVQLVLRPDTPGGAVYCLVSLPRDRYTTDVRLRMRDILRTAFDGEWVDFSARAGESDVTVVSFTVHRRPGAGPADVSDPHRDKLQELLFAATRSWVDRVVAEAARANVPSEIAAEYASAYPETYRQEYEPARALADLRRLRPLAAGAVAANLYRGGDRAPGEWRFTLYVHGEGVSLSRVLPILHSLGMEVVDEHPFRVSLPDGSPRWIYDFGLRFPTIMSAGSADPDAEPTGLRSRFAAAVEALWSGRAEVDGWNEFVVRAAMSWRQISILRAYSKYLQQAGFAYSQAAVTRVLLAHPDVAGMFVDLFAALFDPDAASADHAAELEAAARHRIAEVVSLDADRILRAILGLIKATLRTNYYITDAEGRPRDYLSFKVEPQEIAELPKPRPQFEIWVYSPRVEGVHLRFGPVARGGLRWSDRLEDFRTEILGLVKAQAVKNAVIVPVGAKGGFVVKNPPAATADPVADRQALQG